MHGREKYSSLQPTGAKLAVRRANKTTDVAADKRKTGKPKPDNIEMDSRNDDQSEVLSPGQSAA